MRKKASILTGTVLMIILTAGFFAIMTYSVASAKPLPSFYEKVYAKQIALILDNSKPNTIVTLYTKDIIDIAKSNNKNISEIVKINNTEKKVTVSITDLGKGYSYKFFNTVSASHYFQDDNLILQIVDSRETPPPLPTKPTPPVITPPVSNITPITNISKNLDPPYSGQKARDYVAKKIIETVCSVKSQEEERMRINFSDENFDLDESIKTDTDGRANSFEELMLKLAMQESSLYHCLGYSPSHSESFRNSFEQDPLFCSVLSCEGIHKSSSSYGTFQINPGAHPEFATTKCLFEENIKASILIFAGEKPGQGYTNVKRFQKTPKRYYCPGVIDVDYTGWLSTLRRYNGWACEESGGDAQYINNVLDRDVSQYLDEFGNC